VQDQPDVALLANGKFAVVWSGVAQLDPAGSDRDVFLRLMDRQLVQSGNEIRVNTKRDGHQSRPAVAALGNDKLVVVWDKAANDPDALAAD